MGYSILVADSDQEIYRCITDIFSPLGVAVSWAKEGVQALNMIENYMPQMVFADIDLCPMGGFELLGTMEGKFPGIERVLMTQGDVESFLSRVKEYNIGTVLAKGKDFVYNDIKAYLKGLLEQNTFGLERYFPDQVLKKESITCYSKAKQICSGIAELYPGEASVYVEIAVDELVSNAVFHGVLQLSGLERECWCEQQTIPRQEAVTISWASDNEKLGVSVEDSSGELKKSDMLHWFENSAGAHNQEQMLVHGRGLLLVRKLIDRFIVNIECGSRTECILLQYFNRDYVESSKPVLIYDTNKNYR